MGKLRLDLEIPSASDADLQSIAIAGKWDECAIKLARILEQSVVGNFTGAKARVEIGTAVAIVNSAALGNGSYATGNLTVVNNANIVANTSTITVAGSVLTFIVGEANGAQITIGANLTATAANIAARINSLVLPVTATSAAGVVTVVAKSLGTAGNSLTIATSTVGAVTVSGATLASGANNTAGVLFAAS